jgi:glycosyltransferase involved in cell wall biosynthesis
LKFIQAMTDIGSSSLAICIKNMSALVSVIIPIYDRGSQVLATIESVLAQTIFDRCEIILVNDGSTDDTGEFLTQTYGEHPRIQIIHQRNRGVAAARNRGLKAARGEYIAFLDHDDVWLPEKLEKQLAALRSTPDAAVAYCRWIDVDETGQPLPDERQTTKRSWWQPREGRVHGWFCAPRNPIISMSVPLIRMQALRAADGFDPALVPADDLDLWLRLSARHEFSYVPEALVLYVHHARQQGSDPMRTARAVRKVYAKHWPCLLRHPSLLWYLATFRVFLRSLPTYQRVKVVQRSQPVEWGSLLMEVARRHPLALFSPQWMMLLFRLFTGRNKP